MRILVCGAKNWKDRQYIFNELDAQLRYNGSVVVIGGTPAFPIRQWARLGADVIARRWALSKKQNYETYPVSKVLKDGRPDLVMAFHHNIATSKSTKYIVDKAKKAGITTIVFF